MELSDHPINKPPRKRIPIRNLLRNHLQLLLEDIIVPVRVVVATSVVFVAFLAADQLIFYLIGLSAREIRSRIPFVGWLLDAVQVLSLVAVAVYFVIAGVSNLITQWKINSIIETKAGLK